VKVGGQWRYVYRAIDQFGQVIDVFVSSRRDVGAARRFFERAIGATTVRPSDVVTDRAPTYPMVLEELLPAAWHRTDRYANNYIEADHGRRKSRLRPMRGLNRTATPGSCSPGMALCRICDEATRGRGAGGPAHGGSVRRACHGDLTPDRVATSPRRELISATAPSQPWGWVGCGAAPRVHQ
jgi:DDE domain